jgi:hypothetical protein
MIIITQEKQEKMKMIIIIMIFQDRRRKIMKEMRKPMKYLDCNNHNDKSDHISTFQRMRKRRKRTRKRKKSQFQNLRLKWDLIYMFSLNI